MCYVEIVLGKKMMNKKEAASFAWQVVEQLFNHGWAENYQQHLEYNDHYKIRHAFELAIEGDGKALNKYIDSEEWDEETDIKYDDGGLFSFATEVGKLLRKFKAIDETKQPIKPAKVRVNTSYSFRCPHCDSTNSISGGDARETKCSRCENPVKVEGP